MDGRRTVLITALLSSSIGLASLRAGDAAKKEKISGYAEWRKGHVLVVDGQSVRVAAGAKLKLPKGVGDLDALPLGFEVTAKGLRAADGTLVASELEAKSNETSMFENEARSATTELEAKWLHDGRVYEDRDSVLGDLYTEGRDVERVQRIVRRLMPPYLTSDDFRVYVVESRDWNAFACANGMIVVYTQLLRDMDDDEIAIILGHEMVHATHEHTRRQFKKGFWTGLLTASVLAAADEIHDKAARNAVKLAGAFTFAAWKNGYGRSCEDQADRVGLRYAYEAGYDVTKGPELWNRFARKYGESSKVANFFFGDHSLASARAKKLAQELALNYADAEERHAAMENGDVRYRDDREVDAPRGADDAADEDLAEAAEPAAAVAVKR
jgi:Zn-dependent protease with chaperone function